MPAEFVTNDATTTDSLDTDALTRLCYDRLKRIARNERFRWPNLSDPQTTELVNSAYLRLARSRDWESESAFMAAAANTCREVLVDEARKRTALKRGGKADPLPLDAVTEPAGHADPDTELLALDGLLTDLAELDERLARVVEFRYFAGYSNAESAELLGVNEKTVRRDWLKARAWLRQRMSLPTADA